MCCHLVKSQTHSQTLHCGLSESPKAPDILYAAFQRCLTVTKSNMLLGKVHCHCTSCANYKHGATRAKIS